MRSRSIAVILIVSTILLLTAAFLCLLEYSNKSLENTNVVEETIHRTSSGKLTHLWHKASRIKNIVPNLRNNLFCTVFIMAVIEYVVLIRKIHYFIWYQTYYMPWFLMVINHIKKFDGRKKILCNSL